MTYALVTGAAGFVASHLVDTLLARGCRVRGVDCLTPYYPASIKRDNLARALEHPDFEFIEDDLNRLDLDRLLDGVDVVFHLAGQPGVRSSWAANFAAYLEHNVLATQRLLDAAARRQVRRLVFASSSSVYGEQPALPVREDAVGRPASPYGVTKLACEHLCRLYAESFGVPTVVLRYFTIYGPRQRPDMAVYRVIRAAHTGSSFARYGDGGQVRDFTFVGDAVAATVAAGIRPLPPGTVLNIAGGSVTTLAEVVALVAEVVGRQVSVAHAAAQPGDVARTGASTERARQLLEWSPTVGLREGIKAQVDWQLAGG